MNERTETKPTESQPRPLATPARRRKSRAREEPLVEQHFEGGEPDSRRDSQAPRLSRETYIVVRQRVWVTRWVVAASIVLPVLVLGALLLGLSASGAPLLTAALVPLGILATAVARYFFS